MEESTILLARRYNHNTLSITCWCRVRACLYTYMRARVYVCSQARVRALACTLTCVLKLCVFILTCVCYNTHIHVYVIILTCFHTQFTVCDLVVFEILDLQLRLDANVLSAYPLLSDFHARVAARPRYALDVYMRVCMYVCMYCHISVAKWGCHV